MGTRTGNFPIGFRRIGSEWTRKDPKALADWSKKAGFDAIDLMNVTSADIDVLKGAGLRLGSVDLLDFGNLMANDEGKRKELVAKNVAYVKEVGKGGGKAFFTCIIPGDPSKKRGENYKLAIESYTPIAHACAEVGGALAVEGWPGGGPWLGNLCCTPETCRSFIKDVGKGAGLNYDPSHLIRLGVDHIRFLKEFAPHVKHVHAKDTEIDNDALYEFGTQGATFAKGHGFGEWTWRYTIPGHGQARWGEIFKILKDQSFGGIVSIELEDENFNGSEAGEKAGLTHSLEYLRGI